MDRGHYRLPRQAGSVYRGFGLGEYAIAALAIILQTLGGQPVPAAQQLLVKGARGKIAVGTGLTDAAVAADLDRLMQSLLQEITLVVKPRLKSDIRRLYSSQRREHQEA